MEAACPKGAENLVFPPDRTVEYLANAVQRYVQPDAMHAFRHFYPSWCINRRQDGGLELPPKTVQARLGHSSIVVTLDR